MSDKPPDPADFKRMRPDEAEARRLKEAAQVEADREFQAEMNRTEAAQAKAVRDRKAFEARKKGGTAPAKVYQLLVAKLEGKFKVVWASTRTGRSWPAR